MAEADQKPQTAASSQPAGESPEAKEARLQKRKTWLIRFAILVAAVALIYGAWYLLVGRNHVSTDNAYVNAEVAQVTPLVSAQVVEVLVSDTQPVKKGDVLVRLDDSNMRIAYAQAEADLARAKRMFRQSSATSQALAAQVTARGADIASAEADYQKAKIDLDRRLALQPSGLSLDHKSRRQLCSV